MLSYILKSAEGKSGLITMETLSSDVAKITPTLKVLVFITLIGFLSGYMRLMMVGFNPILQGILLGVALGTLCGKTLITAKQVPKGGITQIIMSLMIGILMIVVHLLGMGYAIPQTDASFLLFSLFANDMREIPHLIPRIGIGPLEVATNGKLWLLLSIADAVLAIIACIIGFRFAIHSKLKSASKKMQSWSVYRMLFLVLGFYGATFIVHRDKLSLNERKYNDWVDEVWAHHYLELLFENEEWLFAVSTSAERIELDEIFEKAKSMDREFPEAHFLTALEQLAKKNYYLARDELGRAILEAEQMTRRTWLQDGTPIHRDILLAQLYQFRAKLSLEKENYLLAERDLTAAIILHREYWTIMPRQLENGFFKSQTELLKAANYPPEFGFGPSHYERHLARLHIDSAQAEKDLEEARSLGYDTSVSSPE